MGTISNDAPLVRSLAEGLAGAEDDQKQEPDSAAGTLPS